MGASEDPSGSLALLTVDDIAEVKQLLRGAAMSNVRMEVIMRRQVEASETIARNTACLPELLDILVGKRTNGHADLTVENENTSEADVAEKAKR